MSLRVVDPTKSIVRDAAALADTCRALRAAGTFGFDTEFIRERSYLPQVCLIQAATADRLALIDPLCVDVAPFWELVLDGGLRKVVHAGAQDLEMCYLRTGRGAANVYDVQIAAGLAGYAYPLSYTKLVQQILRKQVAQGETYSEWAQRPLSPEQLRYAADDVLHLPAIADKLTARLDRLGRLDWLAEEMRPLESVDSYACGSDEIWRRVRGWKALNPQRLAVLRELAQWREAAAREADLPPRSFLRDEVLAAMARQTPRTVEDLATVRGFPRPMARRDGHTILNVLKKGRNAEAPHRPDGGEVAEEDDSARMLTDLVMAARQSACIANKLSPKLFAGRTEYAELVRGLRNGLPDGSPPKLLTGWRAAFAGNTLKAMLEGRRKLRVTNLKKHPRLKLE